MPNIAITSYCNLKCPYCFASEMIQTQRNKNISLDELEHILQWINQEYTKHIGIIGGEPTLHPQFKEILNIFSHFSQLYQNTITLYTNGIDLAKWMPYITDNFFILINLTNPLLMNQNQIKSLKQSLDLLNQLNKFNKSKPQAMLGCNIYIDEKEYKWLWETIDLYNIYSIRVSIASPSGIYSNWRNKKEQYYNLIKPIFLSFCEQAQQHNVKLIPDCHQIPKCYYSEEEYNKISQVIQIPENHFCLPVIDITTDFQATPCFGVYEPVNCLDFSKLSELEQYLLSQKNIKKIIKNKCQNCNNKCQGGCLAFIQE